MYGSSMVGFVSVMETSDTGFRDSRGAHRRTLVKVP